MGQKFFDMHESSRLNMSFKCSGVFNIIYIMRTNVVGNEDCSQIGAVVSSHNSWIVLRPLVQIEEAYG